MVYHGLPNLKMVMASQGYVTNNQMVIDVESDHSGRWDRWRWWSLQGPSLSAESEETRGDSFACTCVFNHYINYIFEVCDTVVDLQNAILVIYSKGVQCIDCIDHMHVFDWTLNIVVPHYIRLFIMTFRKWPFGGVFKTQPYPSSWCYYTSHESPKNLYP